MRIFCLPHNARAHTHTLSHSLIQTLHTDFSTHISQFSRVSIHTNRHLQSPFFGLDYLHTLSRYTRTLTTSQVPPEEGFCYKNKYNDTLRTLFTHSHFHFQLLIHLTTVFIHFLKLINTNISHPANHNITSLHQVLK